MCGFADHEFEHEAPQEMPRRFEGTAIDPFALEAVDEVVVTILVDDSFDALMGDMAPRDGHRFARAPMVPAAQFEGGMTTPGLVAELRYFRGVLIPIAQNGPFVKETVPMPTTHVLVIVTSHGVIEVAPRTGIWFTEFSEP